MQAYIVKAEQAGNTEQHELGTERGAHSSNTSGSSGRGGAVTGEATQDSRGMQAPMCLLSVLSGPKPGFMREFEVTSDPNSSSNEASVPLSLIDWTCISCLPFLFNTHRQRKSSGRSA